MKNPAKVIDMLNGKACALCPYNVPVEPVCAGPRCAAFDYVAETEDIDILAADVAKDEKDRKKQLRSRAMHAESEGWKIVLGPPQQYEMGVPMWWSLPDKAKGYCVRLEAEIKRLKSYGVD